MFPWRLIISTAFIAFSSSVLWVMENVKPHVSHVAVMKEVKQSCVIWTSEENKCVNCKLFLRTVFYMLHHKSISKASKLSTSVINFESFCCQIFTDFYQAHVRITLIFPDETLTGLKQLSFTWFSINLFFWKISESQIWSSISQSSSDCIALYVLSIGDIERWLIYIISCK